MKNQFRISLVQGNFSFQSEIESENPLVFEQISRQALATLIKGMLIARMDHSSATKKSKSGEITLRRAKSNEPFEVYIEQVVENEHKVIVSDLMKFNLTEKSIQKTLLNLPKRLWLMVNDALIVNDPLLAFQAPEYYSKQLIG